jgi:hypothetical protein
MRTEILKQSAGVDYCLSKSKCRVLYGNAYLVYAHAVRYGVVQTAALSFAEPADEVLPNIQDIIKNDIKHVIAPGISEHELIIAYIEHPEDGSCNHNKGRGRYVVHRIYVPIMLSTGKRLPSIYLPLVLLHQRWVNARYGYSDPSLKRALYKVDLVALPFRDDYICICENTLFMLNSGMLRNQDEVREYVYNQWLTKLGDEYSVSAEIEKDRKKTKVKEQFNINVNRKAIYEKAIKIPHVGRLFREFNSQQVDRYINQVREYVRPYGYYYRELERRSSKIARANIKRYQSGSRHAHIERSRGYRGFSVGDQKGYYDYSENTKGNREIKARRPDEARENVECTYSKSALLSDVTREHDDNIYSNNFRYIERFSQQVKRRVERYSDENGTVRPLLSLQRGRKKHLPLRAGRNGPFRRLRSKRCCHSRQILSGGEYQIQTAVKRDKETVIEGQDYQSIQAIKEINEYQATKSISHQDRGSAHEYRRSSDTVREPLLVTFGDIERKVKRIAAANIGIGRESEELGERGKQRAQRAERRAKRDDGINRINQVADQIAPTKLVDVKIAEPKIDAPETAANAPEYDEWLPS